MGLFKPGWQISPYFTTYKYKYKYNYKLVDHKLVDRYILINFSNVSKLNETKVYIMGSNTCMITKWHIVDNSSNFDL